jgi:hypothetical protein
MSSNNTGVFERLKRKYKKKIVAESTNASDSESRPSGSNDQSKYVTIQMLSESILDIKLSLIWFRCHSFRALGPSPAVPVESMVRTTKVVESREGRIPKPHRIRDGSIQLSKTLEMVGDANGLLGPFGPLKTAAGLIGMALETWKVNGIV